MKTENQLSDLKQCLADCMA